MAWTVEYTVEFGEWWQALSSGQQEDVAAHVEELERRGPHLPFPYSSDVRRSRHGQMRELRVQSRGKPLRIFYAFDPRRTAILLIGGDKTGDRRFYERFVPLADKLYDQYLAEISKEQESHGRQAPILGAARANVSRVPRPHGKKS
jgi:hypothetical protein